MDFKGKFDDLTKRIDALDSKLFENLELLILAMDMLGEVMDKYPHVFWECVNREDFERLIKK